MVYGVPYGHEPDDRPPPYEPHPSATFNVPIPSVSYVVSDNGATTIVIVHPEIPWTSKPMEITCPLCQARVLTQTRTEINSHAWLQFLVIFIMGFLMIVPWLLCWIPFCLNKDVIHCCPKCKQYLGRRQIY